MDRRTFISGIAGGLLAAPLAAEAQRSYRLGILEAASAGEVKLREDAFIAKLRELGYAEGLNLAIERRYANGRNERLPGLGGELVERSVGLIFAPTTAAALAAQQNTQTIPIVFATASDPEGSGLIDSLARPGRNATGLSSVNADLTGKRLELLREMAPGAQRIAILCNPRNQPDALQLAQAQIAAPRIGVQIIIVKAAAAGDYEAAFRVVAVERAGALLVIPNSWNVIHQRTILEHVNRARIPVLYIGGEFVRDGGLMSYAADFSTL
jgi:putative ABC transport system substrate-binding protein